MQTSILVRVQARGGVITRGTLDLQETSIYGGPVDWPPAPGKCELAVVAVQKSESNVGIATRPMLI